MRLAKQSQFIPLQNVVYFVTLPFLVRKIFTPIKIMIDQKQLENVESFKYLGSILTNDGRCICEIKCRIAMAKAAFNKKKALFLAHWTWN